MAVEQLTQPKLMHIGLALQAVEVDMGHGHPQIVIGLDQRKRGAGNVEVFSACCQRADEGPGKG